MKALLIILTLFSTIFCKVNDKELFQKLKNYNDNTIVKKDENSTNKVLVKKKETKIDKIVKKNIKKIKATKFTKKIIKEAPKE